LGCVLCSGQVAPVVLELETPVFHVEASPADESYRLSDKAAGVTWSSAVGRFGQISVTENGTLVRYPLAAFTGGDRDFRTLTFHPMPTRPDAWVRVSLDTSRDNRGVDLNYEAAPELKIVSAAANT